MFWNVFSNLCQAANVSPTCVLKGLKIAAGSVTAWKNGTTPSTRSLQKIADYFGVTVADLLADSPTPAPAPAPATPTNEELARQISELRAALPPSSDLALSATRRDAVEMIKKIDESQLDMIINYIKFLESQQ